LHTTILHVLVGTASSCVCFSRKLSFTFITCVTSGSKLLESQAQHLVQSNSRNFHHDYKWNTWFLSHIIFFSNTHKIFFFSIILLIFKQIFYHYFLQFQTTMEINYSYKILNRYFIFDHFRFLVYIILLNRYNFKLLDHFMFISFTFIIFITIFIIIITLVTLLPMIVKIDNILQTNLILAVVVIIKNFTLLKIIDFLKEEKIIVTNLNEK